MSSPAARRPLRVLHVVNFTAVGGIETYTRALFSELSVRGHRNVVIADGDDVPEAATNGTVVHRLGGLAQAGAKHGRSLIAQAKGVIATEPVDVSFLHGWMNSALASFIVRTLPSVLFAHNFGVFCPSGALLYQRTDTVCELRGVPNWRCLANAHLQQCNTRRPMPLIASYRRATSQKKLLTMVDRVVCDSDYVRRRLIDNGAPDELVSVLPAPAPGSTFRNGQASREPIVLFVGRITPQKGLSYLIRAMALVRPPAQLVVAGGGYEMPKMRALTEALGLAERTQYLGILGREDVDALYRRASVLVVPSIWPEPWGIVGPEAMASGLPVVAFRSGGIPEWLAHAETGFLVEPRDVEGLAARIEQLLHDPALVLRLGAAGRVAAKARFTVALHADRLEEVFERAIDGRFQREAVLTSNAARS